MARQPVRTSGVGTETSEGLIKHRQVFGDFGVILAPVKLVKACEGRIATTYTDGGYLLPIPLRRGGQLVYALPGGGEFTG